MHLDLGPELSGWLSLPEVKEALSRIVREAVQAEVKAILDEELLDTKQAAAVLRMTTGAVRKAVERGQLPCVRIGSRLRFRRAELLRIACERGS